ncbi:MAG: DUF4266 domain-containing protein [Myxococcales bacterium]|jgi:hypothetical protein|nr:DUF4266 domain-containing protein [Myxococcales bacterium]
MTLQRLALVASLAVSVLGCAGGVKPWEHRHLAHPTMTTDSVSIGVDEHVRAVTEGAAGDLTGAGGGCGCN